MEKPGILFLGTPAFAVPALSLLIKEAYPLLGVVTQPDRPRGRGRSLAPSPVKMLALEQGVPVLQPERLKDEEFIKVIRRLAPDLLVLAAYGQLLTQDIIDIPPLGCLNIHPSLLPKYRGAAPINWAIINGEGETGVTIMRMAVELDAGDIVLQEKTPIGADENYDQLHDRLALDGAKILIRAIEMTAGNMAHPFPQDSADATYAPRLKKEDGRIHWEKEAAEIVNLIRGLSSVPGAFTTLDGKILKIFEAREENVATGATPAGTLVQDAAGLKVAASHGWVRLLVIQMENKKRMSVEDFLRGYTVQSATLLGR